MVTLSPTSAARSIRLRAALLRAYAALGDVGGVGVDPIAADGRPLPAQADVAMARLRALAAPSPAAARAMLALSSAILPVHIGAP